MTNKSDSISRAIRAPFANWGSTIGKLAYRIARPHFQEEITRILRTKGYDEIGPTEVGSFWNSAFANQPVQNREALAHLYETHPWVFVCTSYIATQLAGIPLRVMTVAGFEDGREVLEGADETPVGQMFRWVNPMQSPFEFNESLISWLLLTGEAYVAFTQPGPDAPAGVPAEMYPLFTPFVEKVTSAATGVTGYKYRVSGQEEFFPAEDVVVFRAWTPAGRFRGQGTTAAGIRTIQTDQRLRAFNDNVLAQGVHLSGTLETEDDTLDAESAELIRGKFEKQYAGSNKAAKIAVLWGGLKFNPQTILQKDIMMDTQLTTNRDEIIAMFGLKPELLTEKFANKATAETVRRMALEDTILGRHGRRVESVWNATGLERFGPEYRVEYDTRDVAGLQTSQKEKIDQGEVAIRSGQMTVNEVRSQIHGLPVVEGLEADTLFLGGQPLAGALDAGGTEEGAKGAPAGTALHRELKTAALANTVIKADEGEFRIVFERDRKAAQNRLALALRSVYRDLRKDVGDVMTRSTVDVNLLAKLEKILYFEGRKAVVAEVTEGVRYAANRSAESQLALLSLETTFDVKPVRALGRLASQEQRIRNMMGTSWVKLRGSIQQGLALGESQKELTARVDGHFQGLKNNAETVARTETLPAINGAAVDVGVAAREAGVDVRSEWITHQDELVRQPPESTKNHAEAHGLTIIPGLEMFQVSGQRLEYPGDSWNGATADNTINCRCGVRNKVVAPNEKE